MRKLAFRDSNDVIHEIERLQQTGYERLGNWSLTQICEHLDKTIQMGFNGDTKRLPWILRATVTKWVLAWSIRNNRMPSMRMSTMPSLIPKSDGENDDPQVIEKCIARYREADQYPGPIRNYPLVNHISVEDWRKIQWMHAARHLGFLNPKGMS